MLACVYWSSLSIENWNWYPKFEIPTITSRTILNLRHTFRELLGFEEAKILPEKFMVRYRIGYRNYGSVFILGQSLCCHGVSIKFLYCKNVEKCINYIVDLQQKNKYSQLSLFAYVALCRLRELFLHVRSFQQ